MSWKTKIYEDYTDKIFGFILYHIRVEEISMDLTHDVFVRLFSSYSIEKTDNIESLIWTITRNRIVDHHRKVAHSRKYRDHLWNQITSANPITDEIEYKETRQLYRQALKNLTPQQSRVYNLVREKELSYKEAGEKLHLSTNTVKNHMVGALKSIRTYLQEHQEKITILILMVGYIF